MISTLKLGKVLGIKVDVHWTFILLIPYIFWTINVWNGNVLNIVLQITFLLAVVLCLLFHELGHILAAIFNKISTNKITLLPTGGIISLKQMPKNPKEELIISLAGPLVNLGIALIIFLIFPIGNTFYEVFQSGLNTKIELTTFPYYLLGINILIFVFNLIPAFPMDGGRAFRAVLSMKIDRIQATKVASSLGQILAIAFFIIGLLKSPIVAMLGIFVFFGARNENFAVKEELLLQGYEVQDAMNTKYITVNPNDTVKESVKKMLEGPDLDLLVIDSRKNILGIATRKKMIEILQKGYAEQKMTREIMSKKFEVIHEEVPLNDIYSKLKQKGNKLFPVKKNDKLKGVINLEAIQQFISMRASSFQHN